MARQATPARFWGLVSNPGQQRPGFFFIYFATFVAFYIFVLTFESLNRQSLQQKTMKATNTNPGLGYASKIERLYAQMLTDLRGAIEAEHGTLAEFVKNMAEAGENFNLSNLYRIFRAQNAQKMSLEHYVRLCGAIGIGGERMRGQRIGASNISLLDYLMIDNDIILKSFLELQYTGS